MTAGTVRNCLITQNNSDPMGGGVRLNGGTIESSTIHNNNTGNVGGGGGIYRNGGTAGTVLNCIVYNNTAPNNATYKNIFKTSDAGITFTCTALPTVSGASNTSSDPMFRDAAEGNYELSLGSPCTNTGSNQGWMSGATDLAGKTRQQGVNVEMGAYEYATALSCDFVASPRVLIASPFSYQSMGPAPFTVQFTATADGANLSGLVYQWDFDNNGTYDATGASVSYTYNTAGVYSPRLNVSNGSETVEKTKANYVSAGSTQYVKNGGNDANPSYTTWATAAATIQAAVNRAALLNGSMVVVSNGTYNITAQISVANPIFVRSFKDGVYGGLNNAAVTTVQRSGGSIRIFSITNPNAAVDGFTMVGGTGVPGMGVNMTAGLVQNCIVRNNGGDNQLGAGVFMSGGTVQGCKIFSNNANNRSGGGVYMSGGGQLLYSEIYGNAGGSIFTTGGGFIDGGGVFATSTGCLIRNCLIRNNTATGRGAGVAGGTVESCTIVANNASTATSLGGGTFGGVLTDSIVMNNTLSLNATKTTENYSGGTFTYSCSSPLPAGAGNVSSVSFRDVAVNDYRLSASAPVDAGTTLSWMTVPGTLDLAGVARIQGAQVDMGAYEGVPAVLACDFGSDVTSVLAPGVVNFSSSVFGGTPASYAWTFGDGGTASTANPTYTYNTPGVYTVTLTVTGTDAQVATKTKTNYITAWGPDAYVVSDGSSTPQAPYDTWAKAAATVTAPVVGAPNGVTIWLKAGTHNVASELIVDRAITVRSVAGDLTGAATTIVRASSGGYRLFNVIHANAALRGITIRDAGAVVSGNGVNMSAGLVRDCIIMNNGFSDNHNGSGVAMSGGTLQNCIVKNNGGGSGVSGSGIYATGGLIIFCQILDNAIFTDNQPSTGGGGVYLAGGILRNCLIARNSVGGTMTINALVAGGVYLADGTVESCTIVANSGKNGGGGIYRNNGTAGTVVNSIVYNNTAANNATYQNFYKTTDAGITYTCTTQPNAAGTGNTSSDPLLVAVNDYHLKRSPLSPCINVGNNAVVTWLTDLDGNTRKVGVAGSEVVDMGAYEVQNQAPVCDGAAIAAQSAGGNCQATISAALVTGVNDADGDATILTVSPTTLNLGANSVLVTATDPIGGFCSKTITVQVLDNIAPVPNVAALPDVTGQCSVTLTAPTATDNCAGTVTATTADPMSYNAQGTYTVTWKYDDGNGNITLQGQTVVVDDTIAPIVTCPANIDTEPDGVVQPCSDSDVAVGLATASDNCGVVSLEGVRSDGRPLSDPYYEGVTTIRWTATDVGGNTSYCDQTVTVQDNEAPAFATPEDMVVSMNPNPADPYMCFVSNNVIGAFVTYPTITPVDNVAGAKVDVYFDPPAAPDGSFFGYTAPNANPANVHTVTCWAIDECGNRSADATFTVTVQDNLPPQFVDNQPPSFLDECTGVVLTNEAGVCYSYQVFPSPQAEDGCDPLAVVLGVSAVSQSTNGPIIALSAIAEGAPDPARYAATNDVFAIGGAFPVGTNFLITTATDGAGNSTRRICEVVVVDGEAPVITLVGDNPTTVECHTAYTDAGASVSGACDEGMVPSASSDVDVNTPGAYTVTYNLTDAAGNMAEPVTRTVNVVDTTKPQITILGANPATVECHAGYTDAGASAADTCAGDLTAAIVTDNPVDADEPDLYEVTYTVADPTGNSQTATRAVLVQDTTPPAMAAQDITVNLDTNGNASITAAQVDNGSIDACGAVTLSVTPSTFNCANVGTVNTVTLTGVDQKGNTAAAVATVMVVDDTPPVAKAQDLTMQLNAAGVASITAGLVDNGSSDNCGIATLTVAPNAFACSNVGPNTVTLTVTDVNGNVATAQATVTVEDMVLPAVLTQDITVNLDAAGAVSITAEQVNNGSSDSCGIASMSVAPSDFTCDSVGPNVVTLTVTDVHGNTATAEAVVTVVDVTPPVISAAGASATIACPAEPVFTAPTATDACSAEVIVVSDETEPGACAGTHTRTITWIAMDANGNESDLVSQTITVADTTAPAITCPADVGPVDPADYPNGALGTATASDTCDGTVTPTYVDASQGIVNGIETITRTWTATDDCGNSQSCEQTITVQRNQAPVCNAAAIAIQTAGADCQATISGALVTGVTDPDGDTLTITVSPTTLVLGDNPVTVTANDGKGGSCSTVITVTVVDTTAPVITTCPPARTIVSGPTSCASTVPDLTAEVVAEDNCGGLTVTQSPAAGSPLGLGLTVVTLTATDTAGNQTTCTVTLTVAGGVKVAFQSPVADDNDPSVTAIPGSVGNKVRRGQVVPHKVVVTSCSGQALTSGLTVKVRVQGLELSGTTLSVFNDVVEDANGVGSDGTLGNDGIMVLTDGKYHFNLDTSNFADANTFGNANRFYRSWVRVYDSAGNLLGEEDAILETR